MKGTFKLLVSGLMLILSTAVGAQAPVPADYISVGDYSGTANQRINAAIAAAMSTDHKTVYFPNGTYALQSGLNLNQGTNTELHLIGESRAGVFLIPDIPYLEANYNGGSGARVAHMLNLSSGSVFDSVDVSIQNMTIDMRHQLLMGEPTITYNVVGHGIRIGQGWKSGKFLVNHVAIRNVGSYGVGIQDRGGHPKSNVTLTNLSIERTGSDAIDTKEASGDGNRNLVVRNLTVNEIGFLDTGAANAIDLRYRTVIIENANLVSQASRSTLPGQTSSNSGINFRAFEAGAAGILQASVSNVYLRGFSTGIAITTGNGVPHQNISISDFKIHGQTNLGISISGSLHSGHTISNGYIDPAFGNTIRTGGLATVSNVIQARWDPVSNPTTYTTVEGNVSLAGTTFSPAREGIVSSERISLNSISPSPSPLVFNLSNTGKLQIDYDGFFNEMDKLVVEGTLQLGGQLDLKMVDSLPSSGGTFQILEADEITGSFDSISLPAVQGLVWVTDKLTTDGTISLLEVTSLINPVNQDFHVDANSLGNDSSFVSFDAGAEADMLMVAVSSERSNEVSPKLYYGGRQLTPVVEQIQAGIWTLDLTKTNYTGGQENLVIDFAGINTVNGVALGIVSVEASGRAIKVHSFATGSASASLISTRYDAFVLASFNANMSGSPTVASPLSKIYTSGNIGSAQGAAAYQINVGPGTHAIDWTTDNKRRVVAAAFVVETNYSDWIDDYNLGGQIDLGDDPDRDGLPHGVEAWFGGHPAVFSSGLANFTLASNESITFNHPVSSSMPEDLEGFYQWSMNLTDWYACDGVEGPVSGERVTSSSLIDSGTANVTIAASESMERLFIRPAVRFK